MQAQRKKSALRRTMRRVRKRARNFWGGRFGPLPRPDKWVFIVGCYNSGTTLLHDILATHPDVGSMPTEGHFLTDELLQPQDVGLARLWATKPELFYMDETSNGVDVARLMRQWGAQFNAPKRSVLLEKTPVNAARMRWLQVHFPQAYFIGIIRNGYAVAEGIRRKVGHPLDLAARQWATSNEVMLRDWPYIEHKYEIRYEDLTERPEAYVREILAFLGLSADGLDLEGRSWQIHERTSEIRNMNDRSFRKLTDDDRATIEREAGPMLQRLNYTARA